MNILALVDSPDHVCCRYRIRAFEPAVRRAGGAIAYQALGSGLGKRLVALNRAARFDAVLLQRKLLPTWQLRILRARARRLIFDFDDAVLYRDSNDPRGPECPRRRRRFETTVRLADVTIAGNDFLADCALRAGAVPETVRVIPTCVDPAAYPARTAPPPNTSGADRGLRLVWIGSSSTLRGLERRTELWKRIGREVPGATLRVVSDRFPDFAPLPIEPIPWSEAVEAEALATADAGISWIPDDLWSRGKCGLKVVQYQAAGLPTVANAVGVHPEMIRDGSTGFLADSETEWLDAIRALANDPERCLAMGRAARTALETGYSIEVWASTFVAAIGVPVSAEAAGSGRVVAHRGSESTCKPNALASRPGTRVGKERTT